MARRAEIAEAIKRDIGVLVTIGALANWLQIDRSTVRRRLAGSGVQPQSRDGKYYWYEDVAAAIYNF